jgi:predicted transglutaminase-like cysteine proteinase
MLSVCPAGIPKAGGHHDGACGFTMLATGRSFLVAFVIGLGLLPGAAAAAPEPDAQAYLSPLGSSWSLRPSLPALSGPGAAFGPSGRTVSWHAATARWEDVRRRAEAGEPFLERCRTNPEACDGGALRRWAALMQEAAGASPQRQVGLVNRGVNLLLAYRSDESLYGLDEYWASPLEALTNGGGDCEDYALLKLWSLKLLGFDPDTLAVLVVWDPARREHHAILSAAFDGHRLALDSHHAVVLPVDGTPYRPVFVAGFAGQAVYDPMATAQLRP